MGDDQGEISKGTVVGGKFSATLLNLVLLYILSHGESAASEGALRKAKLLHFTIQNILYLKFYLFFNSLSTKGVTKMYCKFRLILK